MKEYLMNFPSAIVMFLLLESNAIWRDIADKWDAIRCFLHFAVFLWRKKKKTTKKNIYVRTQSILTLIPSYSQTLWSCFLPFRVHIQWFTLLCMAKYRNNITHLNNTDNADYLCSQKLFIKKKRKKKKKKMI